MNLPFFRFLKFSSLDFSDFFSLNVTIASKERLKTIMRFIERSLNILTILVLCINVQSKNKIVSGVRE